jgi:hypothetical protein
MRPCVHPGNCQVLQKRIAKAQRIKHNTQQYGRAFGSYNNVDNKLLCMPFLLAAAASCPGVGAETSTSSLPSATFINSWVELTKEVLTCVMEARGVSDVYCSNVWPTPGKIQTSSIVWFIFLFLAIAAIVYMSPLCALIASSALRYWNCFCCLSRIALLRRLSSAAISVC